MSNRPVPDILIEQYALGELAPEKAAEVERSAGFATRLEALRCSDASILASYPADRFAARIRNQFAAGTRDSVITTAHHPRGARFQRPALRWLSIALPGAAALAVGALIAFGGLFGGAADRNAAALDEAVRLKGGAASLTVYRLVEGPRTEDASAEKLTDGSVARAGDRLQLAYNAGEMRYGLIVSVDRRGAVYAHFPLDLSSPPRLIVGRTRQLDYAYQLDDAPRFERFYFITSLESFSAEDLIRSVRAQAADIAENGTSLRVGPEFDVTSVTIVKGE